jgi:hypothetical protein
MTSSVIAKLLVRHPFQRFILSLPDNTEVMVNDPEQVEHDRGSEILILKPLTGREIIVDLRLVARVDVLAPGER